MDKTDRRILDVLQQDGKISNIDLAEKVNLTPAPCLRRVAALEQSGVIRGYVALLDPLQVGLGLLVFVNVKLVKGGKMPSDRFSDALAAWPEVVACYSLTGNMDYLLRVHVPDLQSYNRFMSNKLLRQEGVIDVSSSIVLEQLKDTTALPLQHLAP